MVVNHLTRQPDFGHPDSYQQESGPWKYYERVITAGDPDTWFTLPDIAFPVSVTVSPQNGGGAFIEATDSPAAVLDASYTKVAGLENSPILYTYQGDREKDNFGGSVEDPIVETTHLLILGPSAIKLRITAGSAILSIRC